jgi:hypothetical protein
VSITVLARWIFLSKAGHAQAVLAFRQRDMARELSAAELLLADPGKRVLSRPCDRPVHYLNTALKRFHRSARPPRTHITS